MSYGGSGRVTGRYGSRTTGGYTPSSNTRSRLSSLDTDRTDRTTRERSRDGESRYSTDSSSTSRYSRDTSRDRDSTSRYSRDTSRDRDSTSRYSRDTSRDRDSTSSYSRYKSKYSTENDSRSTRLQDREESSGYSSYSIRRNVESDDNSKVKRDIENTRADIAKIENVLTRFERELEQAKRSESEVQARVQFRTQEGETTRRKLEDNLAKLERDTSQELSRLQDDLAKAERMLQDLEVKQQSLETSSQRDFSKEFDDLERTLADEKRQLVAIGDHRISELSDLVRDEKAKLRKTQDQRNEAENELKKVIKQMDEENEKAREIEDMKRELSDKERTLAKLTQEVDRAEFDMRAIREKAETLEQADKESQNMRDSIRELENELNHLQDTNSDLETERKRTIRELEEELREKQEREAQQQQELLEAPKRRERSSSNVNAEDYTGENAEKKIKTLRRKLRDKALEWENELEDYARTLNEAEEELAATQNSKQEKSDKLRDFELLTRQQTELHEAYVAEAEKRIAFLEKEIGFAIEERDLSTQTMEKLKQTDQELKEDSEKTSASFIFSRDKASKMEVEIKQKTRSLERTEKDLTSKLITYRDLKDNLVDIEAQLAQTVQDLEQTTSEFEIVKEDLETEQETLEHELYILTCMKEYFMVKNYELDKEYTDVSWYFKPAEEQKKTIPQNSTSMYRYILQNIEKRRQKTETTKEIILEGRPKNSSLEELSRRFQEALAMLEEEDPESHHHTVKELKEFYIKLDVAETPPKLKLWLATVLVEHQVYPGAIRELGNLVDLQLLEEIHQLYTPEWLLKFTYREYMNQDEISFRRILLNNLVELKVKQTNRSAVECEDYIFVGRWRDNSEIEAHMAEFRGLEWEEEWDENYDGLNPAEGYEEEYYYEEGEYIEPEINPETGEPYETYYEEGETALDETYYEEGETALDETYYEEE